MRSGCNKNNIASDIIQKANNIASDIIQKAWFLVSGTRRLILHDSTRNCKYSCKIVLVGNVCRYRHGVQLCLLDSHIA